MFANYPPFQNPGSDPAVLRSCHIEVGGISKKMSPAGLLLAGPYAIFFQRGDQESANSQTTP